MQKFVDAIKTAGLVQVEERPTSGRYMQMWITTHQTPTIWSETIEVDEYGEHWQWAEESDDFTKHYTDPLVGKIHGGEIMFFAMKGNIGE